MSKQDDEIRVMHSPDEKSNELVHRVRARESSVTETLDDRIEPNDEELATLRRISEPIPMRAWYTLISYL